VTEAIDALERDGLVRRTADPVDRRAKRLSITPAGEAALAASEPARQKFLEDIFGQLSSEERHSLSATLRKMNHRLEQIERG
jgi:DNA-binding MarR family transcriptional regulator